jgi:tol-pal system protein YbgF
MRTGLIRFLVPALAISLACASPAAAERPSYSYRGGSYGVGGDGAEVAPNAGSELTVVQQLEEEVRSLTGRIEQTERRLELLERKYDDLERQSKAAASRPSPVESAVIPHSGGRRAEIYPKTDDNDAASPPSAPVSVKESPFVSPDGTAPEASPPPETTLKPEELYDQALNALKNEDYVTSQTLFNRFLETHKSHKLAPNAHYWLGESYYAAKRYNDAAIHFLNGYQADKKGGKAADNLLKLGMSLRMMEKKTEACATFDKLLGEFPSGDVAGKARQEQKDSGC